MTGGAFGRTWTRSVLDPEVAAKVVALLRAWPVRPLARKIGVRREAIDSVAAGRPMTRKVWDRIARALDGVPLVPSQEDVAPIRRRREIRPKTQLCVECGRRRVQARRAVAHRGVCSSCSARHEIARMSRCDACGSEHRGNDNVIATSFCCLLVPEKVGECGWCGADLVRLPNETEREFLARRFCGKPCSISFHADASRGKASEAMVGVAFHEVAL